jgi:hypothetical protein
MEYFLNRQNPLKDTVTDKQIDRLFKEIVDTFGKEWLEQKGNHVLQKLWGRKDALSTNELFTLASALKNLNTIDSSWVSHQVDQILSDNVNNQIGAFFELIGLNLLVAPGIDVKPAPKNQRGIDGIVEFKNGGSINLSIKNYGLSSHHISFLEESEKFKEYLKKALPALGIPRIQIFIDSPKNYPSSGDWKKLTCDFSKILRNFHGTFISDEIGSVWQISLSDIVDENNNFHPKYSSYTIALSSIYHKNESMNLISKMESAASNLAKSGIKEGSENLNFIFFRLPLTISADNCIQWATDYFTRYHSDSISGAIFYQTAIVSDSIKNTSFISHLLKPVFSSKYIEWKKDHLKSNLAFNIPVGVPINKPSYMVFTDGKENIFSIDGRYIYQNGEHYVKARITPNGFEGDIKHLGPGLQQYTVLDNEKTGHHIIGGHFGDKLLIL